MLEDVFGLKLKWDEPGQHHPLNLLLSHRHKNYFDLASTQPLFKHYRNYDHSLPSCTSNQNTTPSVSMVPRRWIQARMRRTIHAGRRWRESRDDVPLQPPVSAVHDRGLLVACTVAGRWGRRSSLAAVLHNDHSLPLEPPGIALAESSPGASTGACGATSSGGAL